MKSLIHQSNDPNVEAGLKETRPFFVILILVLVFLYSMSVYSAQLLRQPAMFVLYTMIFIVHAALHWMMPRIVTQNLVVQKRRLVVYLVVQTTLVILLILISRQSSIVIGLYLALAGEIIGILDDLRWSLAIAVGFLVLMGITYGILWGWDATLGWLSGSLLMMVLVISYVYLFMRQLNARAQSQRLLEELQEAHAKLAEYAQQVETLTLEGERQRMARELHDTLAQGLAGLVLQLEALEASLERDNPEKALMIAGQAKERARITLAEARGAIDDLRLTEMTTAEAINREVERFTKATGIPCDLVLPPKLNLSAKNGEHLLRCVSEGLANVTQHARATQVWVTVGVDEGLLHIKIHDNGRGFDTKLNLDTGHYGLLGLRERARIANGELTIESSPGAGTTIYMTIPVRAKNGTGNREIEGET